MRGTTTTRARYGKNRQTGVTLIELMMVLAVVGILTIIAVPAYRKYSIRAHRTEAKAALLKLQTDEERYYLDNHGYTTDPTTNGWFPSSKSEDGNYTITITTATASGLPQDYTATATAGGSMADDAECTSFTLKSTGVRSASPDPNGSCW